MLKRLWNKCRSFLGSFAWIGRWFKTRDTSLALHEILLMVDPDSAYVDRCRWVIELGFWLKSDDDLEQGKKRLLHLLQILEHHPETARKIAQTLSSVMRESDPVSLLCDVGLPVKTGFWSELGFRVHQKWLPPPPNRGDLADVFRFLFNDERDARWVMFLEERVLKQVFEVFFFPLREGHQQKEVLQNLTGFGKNCFLTQYRFLKIEDAITHALSILLSRLVSFALNPALRALQPKDLDSNPFLLLLASFEKTKNLYQELLQSSDVYGGHKNELAWQLYYLRGLLQRCDQQVQSMYLSFESSGISVESIFYLHAIDRCLQRFELLLDVWLVPDIQAYRKLWVALIESTVDQSSLRRLFARNYTLLARRISERSAETGEHYIVHSREESRKMFRAACGGGAMTAGTVFLKFLISSLHLKPFAEGLLFSINYAGSFIAIHLANFTLATKQPAMTGPALVKSLLKGQKGEGLGHGFVRDTVAMIRSNLVAIFGNLLVVFPVAFLVQWGLLWMGSPVISPQKAKATLISLDIFGATPIYAVFTGILLWWSSLISGWVDNWFAYHRVYDVLRYHRRLNFVLGSQKLNDWVETLKRQIAPLSANISLGLLLGVLPVVISFFGPTLDVRHVTLATGSMAVALATLGYPVLLTSLFWHAILGILITGFLNLFVSFSLAFLSALRASGLRSGDRKTLAWKVIKYILRHPTSLWRAPN